jgi:SecD/SecF fusion protein
VQSDDFSATSIGPTFGEQIARTAVIAVIASLLLISQIANRSMSEVFTRSLATSFVVLMPVGSLLLFGGETLKDFAFALLVGVMSGAYSSIFIATPVLVEWKEREPIYMRRRRLVMEENAGVVPPFASETIGEAGADEGAATTRERRAARKATRAGSARRRPAAAPPPVPPPEETPAGDGGDGRPADGKPPEPEERAPAPEADPQAGNGEPPAAPARPRPASSVTSTAGAGAPESAPKPKRRPRKKHGRR